MRITTKTTSLCIGMFLAVSAMACGSEGGRDLIPDDGAPAGAGQGGGAASDGTSAGRDLAAGGDTVGGAGLGGGDGTSGDTTGGGGLEIDQGSGGVLPGDVTFPDDGTGTGGTDGTGGEIVPAEPIDTVCRPNEADPTGHDPDDGLDPGTRCGHWKYDGT